MPLFPQPERRLFRRLGSGGFFYLYIEIPAFRLAHLPCADETGNAAAVFRGFPGEPDVLHEPDFVIAYELAAFFREIAIFPESAGKAAASGLDFHYLGSGVIRRDRISMETLLDAASEDDPGSPLPCHCNLV